MIYFGEKDGYLAKIVESTTIFTKKTVNSAFLLLI